VPGLPQAPPAKFGALADRYDCRKLIQGSQALFMAVSLTWGILFATGTLTVWNACALLLGLGPVHGICVNIAFYLPLTITMARTKFTGRTRHGVVARERIGALAAVRCSGRPARTGCSPS
jgi:MFS family permease